MREEDIFVEDIYFMDRSAYSWGCPDKFDILWSRWPNQNLGSEGWCFFYDGKGIGQESRNG